MGAIAAAVIAAGATVYSVQAQKKAAEKAASAGGSGADIYGRSTDMPSYMPVDQTVFDPAADKNRYINQMLPASIDAAKRSTNYGIKQRERLMPGFKSIMAGAGGTLSRWMAGDVPDDVKDSVMRSIAEKSGGTAGAGTGYKDDFARSIGKIGAIDLPGQALQLGPTWMKLADSFVTKPEEAFGSIMDFIKAKYGYAASSDALKVHQAESIYTSEVNKERSDAMPNPQALGMRNDATQVAALNAQADAKQAQALAGIASSAITAYGGRQQAAVPNAGAVKGFSYNPSTGYTKA